MDPKELGQLVGRGIKLALGPIEARLQKLEEAQTKTFADAWKGVWVEGARLKRGDVVTHKSGLWLCTADDPKSAPGADGKFRLILRAKS